MSISHEEFLAAEEIERVSRMTAAQAYVIANQIRQQITDGTMPSERRKAAIANLVACEEHIIGIREAHKRPPPEPEPMTKQPDETEVGYSDRIRRIREAKVIADSVTISDLQGLK